MKLSTSAPFAADVKADVLRRWPGGLTEYYGLTEGGGSCVLVAHLHPDKLHTVGQPSAGHDIRLIDEAGKEVPKGEIGEIVGHSAGIMSWILQAPRADRRGGMARRERQALHPQRRRRPFRRRWLPRPDGSQEGHDHLRRVQHLPERSGSRAVKHEAIAEAAVVGVASDRWGETPVAFVVLKAGSRQRPEEIRDWLNGQVGKTQRLSGVEIVPRPAAQRHRQGLEARAAGSVRPRPWRLRSPRKSSVQMEHAKWVYWKEEWPSSPAPPKASAAP